MRLHLVHLGRKTSISVDDQLIVYLQKRLIKGDTGTEKGRLSKARLWIQHMVNAAGDLLPTKGISQWVQARIIDAIADPLLKDEAKIAEEAELTARSRNLATQNREAWLQTEMARKTLEDQKKMYEEMAKNIAKKTPRYRSPPKVVT